MVAVADAYSVYNASLGFRTELDFSLCFLRPQRFPSTPSRLGQSRVALVATVPVRARTRSGGLVLLAPLALDSHREQCVCRRATRMDSIADHDSFDLQLARNDLDLRRQKTEVVLMKALTLLLHDERFSGWTPKDKIERQHFSIEYLSFYKEEGFDPLLYSS